MLFDVISITHERKEIKFFSPLPLLYFFKANCQHLIFSTVTFSQSPFSILFYRRAQGYGNGIIGVIFFAEILFNIQM